MDQNKKKYVYILTNPSFPSFVKIGYADDVQKRVKQLNDSTAVPFEFQIYATYEVSTRCGDHEIHRLIDSINPVLRDVQERENGRLRKRGFYAIAPEEAYGILEAIAKLTETTDKLKKKQPTNVAVEQEKLAEDIEEITRKRKPNFSFRKCGINPGSTIVYAEIPSIVCTVVDDRRVEYQGSTYYLSALATEISGRENIPGTHYFTYNGELLSDIDARKNA